MHRKACISSFDERLTTLELEIIETYKHSFYDALLEYTSLDTDEQKMLLIQALSIEDTVLHIRAPVPWHQSSLMATHALQYNLFIGNEILRDIQDLYFFK